MSSIGDLLGGLLGLAAVILFLYVWLAPPINSTFEKIAFRKMITNLNDHTVNSYIRSFNKSYCFGSGWLNMVKAVNHRNNQLRQSNGWETIKNSDKVSIETKERLKTAFISRGVPLH